MHKIINAVKTILLALALSFGLSYVYAWTAPTSNPPAGNVSAPINTSATLQQKSGDFTVANFIANTMTIGGTINANAITAPQFCIGASCITAWPGKEMLLSGTWLGSATASQGDSLNPRYTSIEITPSIRDKCRMDTGLNVCRLTILSISKYGTPRAFDHFFATRKEGTKEYVFIEETIYDNSLVIGDGVVQHMDAGSWAAGCNWRNLNDGNDMTGNFALCERKALSDGTWYDTTKDDTSLWLSVDQQDVVSTYYYMYK